jgi:hypothetical protein
MCAASAEGEELLATSRDNDWVSMSVAKQHGAITHLGFGDPFREIRTGQLAAFHFISFVEAE